MKRVSILITAVVLFSCGLTTNAHASTVEKSQRMLNQLGYNAGPIDGAYGGKTRTALEAFYADNGSTYDGKLDANEVVDLTKAMETRSSNLKIVMKDSRPRGLGPREWGGWNQDMPTSPWVYNLTNIVPARSGKLSQRFELRHGDCTTMALDNHPADWGCNNDRERTEVMHTQWTPGKDKWIGFSVKIKTDEWSKAQRNHCTTIFQIKQTEYNVYQGNFKQNKTGDYSDLHYIGSAPVMFGVVCGDKVIIRIKEAGFDESKFYGWVRDKDHLLGYIDASDNEWIDVAMRWDTTRYRKGQSTFEFYINGKLQVKEHNITNNFFPDVYTFKYGLYRGYMKANNGPNFKIGTQVIYFDEVRTGRNFEAVNPATNRALD